MPDTALRRTIRRCTAVLVLVIALGFEELAEYGFDAALLFAGPAGAYLVVSVLFRALFRFDDLAGSERGDDSPDGPSADDRDPATEGDA